MRNSNLVVTGLVTTALALGYGEYKERAGYDSGYAQGTETSSQEMQAQQEALAKELEETKKKVGRAEENAAFWKRTWEENDEYLRVQLEEAQAGVCNTGTEEELALAQAANALARAQLAELHLEVDPTDHNAIIDGLESLDCPSAYVQKRSEAREWIKANKEEIAAKVVEVCASDQIPRKDFCPESEEAAKIAIDEALELDVADKCSPFVTRELANAEGHTPDGTPIVRFYPEGYISTPDGENQPWNIDDVDPKDIAGRELHERMHWTSGLRHEYGENNRLRHDGIYAYHVATTLVGLESDGEELRILTNGEHWFDFTEDAQ